MALNTRITHALAEVLRGGDPKARITHVLSEIIRSNGYNVTATIDALILTEHNPTVGVGIPVNVEATLDALTLTEYAVNVNKKLSFTAGVDELVFTEYSSTINKEISLIAGDALYQAMHLLRGCLTGQFPLGREEEPPVAANRDGLFHKIVQFLSATHLPN